MYQRYIELRAKGAVLVRKNAGELEMVAKRFDQDTGEEIGERVCNFTLSYLQEEKAILLAVLENIDALIADTEALEAPE